MALSESVDLNISAALGQVKRIDTAMKSAIEGTVTLDTTKALAQATKLRTRINEVFAKNVTFGLSTVEASKKITVLRRQVVDVRNLIGRKLEFNVSTSEAGRKLQQLQRQASSLRNTIREANTAKNQAAKSEAELQQRGLNNQLNRYNKLVPASIIYGDSFTAVLRNQAIQAGLLAGQMQTITAQVKLFNQSVSTSSFGLTQKQLMGVNKGVAGFNPGQFTAASTAQLNAINSNLASIGQTAAGVTPKVNNVFKGLSFDAQSINQQLIAAGRTLTTLTTLPILVTAAFAAFNEFKFQETINRTRVLTNAFDDIKDSASEVKVRIDAMRDTFGRIASETGQSPQAIAEGFYFVASAGGAVATQMSILRVAAEGAAIGLGSVEVVADTLTSVLNAYGEEVITAAEAGDILVQSVNDAKVEASDFAPQLGRLLPIAANLGIGFDQVSAAMARLTQNGNSAGVASTQLRGILQTLIRPTSQKAADLLQSVGLDTAQLREQIRTGGPAALIDVLDRLRRNSGLTLEELSSLFRRVDAFQGFLSLTDDADKTRAVFERVTAAAENTSGSLDEFERFARDNQALQIRQQFSEILVALQPLGVKVLPLVIKGLGIVIDLIGTLGDLFTSDFIGPIAIAATAVTALSGPLLILVGRVRQIEQAFTRLKLAAQFKGGLSSFLGGTSLAQIQSNAAGAGVQVSRMGQALGALPGLLGVAGAASIAFFGGTALAADDLKTQLVGVATSIAGMGLAFTAAKSAASAFGFTSSAVLTGVGAVAAGLVAGIAIWQAYKTETEKSDKALGKFQESLRGLTANESIKKFGATLNEALKGITEGDRTTNLEIPEITKSLQVLGLTTEDLGRKLANIVIFNPNDLNAQKRALEGLAESMGDVTTGGRLDDVSELFDILNAQGRGNEVANGMLSIAEATDETADALDILRTKGLLAFGDGTVSITDMDAAAKALGERLGGDTLKLLDGLTEAFRRARETALETTGEFTLTTNAAGSFVESLDENGDSVIEFASDTDEAAKSLAGLREEFNALIETIFGLDDKLTLGKLADNLETLRADVQNEIADNAKKQNTNPEGEDFDANKINFEVVLEGANGVPARQYIRERVSEIDDAIAQFAADNPEVPIQTSLDLREGQIQQLATDIGVSVETVQTLLAADGNDTLTLGTKLTELNGADIQAQMLQFQSLLDQAPLDLTVKAQIEAADAETQNALFGSELIDKALKGNSRAVIDFVLNAQTQGVPVETLNSLFSGTDVSAVKNVVVQAIEEGTSTTDIAKLLLAIGPEIRTQLVIDPPKFSSGDNKFLDNDLAHFKNDEPLQMKINAIVDEAEILATQEGLVTAPTQMPVTPIVDEAPIAGAKALAEAGAVMPISVSVDAGGFNTFIANATIRLRNLSSLTNLVGAEKDSAATGGVFNGAGFRTFARGGVVTGVRRQPMIARAPRGKRGILWGEPSTGGEAYIPFNPRHRARAEHILGVTARQFGMEVTRAVGGTVKSYATGGVVNAPIRSSGGSGSLARQVANLAAVVASRQQIPMIGDLTIVSDTTNPEATARYVAADIAGRVLG